MFFFFFFFDLFDKKRKIDNSLACALSSPLLRISPANANSVKYLWIEKEPRLKK
mgnify:CR=1 FL=1